MSVATHLNISLDEYDIKIRSFIPRYEAMIATAARVLRLLGAPSPLIVDLGIGTGALAEACLAERPDGRLYGVDEDAGMLDLARARLAQRPNTASLVHGSFVHMPLPDCDAVVASLALHHVRTSEEKGSLYGPAAC
jgi:ubiquinone/menaquinone biosynthesis C-methylase UbiE